MYGIGSRKSACFTYTEMVEKSTTPPVRRASRSLIER